MPLAHAHVEFDRTRGDYTVLSAVVSVAATTAIVPLISITSVPVGVVVAEALIPNLW